MKLTNDELNMVEAIYICIRDQRLTPDIELGLLVRLYDNNIYAYIYLDWLVNRWAIYGDQFDSLPKRAK